MEGVDGGPVEELLEEFVAGTSKLIPWINIVKCIKLVLWVILLGLLFKHSVFPLENQPQLVVPSERSASSERSNPDSYCVPVRGSQEVIMSYKKREQEQERHKLIYSILLKVLLPLAPGVGTLRAEAKEQFGTGPTVALRSEGEHSFWVRQWVEKERNTSPAEEEDEKGAKKAQP